MHPLVPFESNVEGWTCLKGKFHHGEEFLALHESSPNVSCGDTEAGAGGVEVFRLLERVLDTMR